MTDDLDDLLARIDALEDEPPPDDEWEWTPDQEEQMALLDVDDEPVEPLDRPDLDTFDLMYAMAVLRGLVRPHRELTDAEEIAGRITLADDPGMLIVMPTYRSYEVIGRIEDDGDYYEAMENEFDALSTPLAYEDPYHPDAMRVRGYQGSLGFRWL